MVERLHRDDAVHVTAQRRCDGRLAGREVAHVRDDEGVGLEHLLVRVDEVAEVADCLFFAFNDDLQVDRRLRSVRANRASVDGDARLVVGGTAAEDAAILASRSEWVGRPSSVPSAPAARRSARTSSRSGCRPGRQARRTRRDNRRAHRPFARREAVALQHRDGRVGHLVDWLWREIPGMRMRVSPRASQGLRQPRASSSATFARSSSVFIWSPTLRVYSPLCC